MAVEPNELLALIAVRMKGGSVSDKDAKGIKVDLAKAVAAGVLESAEIDVTPISKSGKPGKPKMAKVFRLTESGTAALTEAGSHDVTVAEQTALRAGAASKLEAESASATAKIEAERLETTKQEAALRKDAKKKIEADLKAQSQKLLQKVETDRAELKKKFTDALPKKIKAQDAAKLEKELETITKGLSALTDKVQKLAAALHGGVDGDAIVKKIDDAFAGLVAKLPQATPEHHTAATPHVHETHPAPKPQVTHPAPVAAQSLEAVLYDVYEELRPHTRDRLVELPKVFHKAHAASPSLTVAAFHEELNRLWHSRKIELHVLNEVIHATERDKGVERDGKLYYYLLWKHQ